MGPSDSPVQQRSPAQPGSLLAPQRLVSSGSPASRSQAALQPPLWSSPPPPDSRERFQAHRISSLAVRSLPNRRSLPNPPSSASLPETPRLGDASGTDLPWTPLKGRLSLPLAVQPPSLPATPRHVQAPLRSRLSQGRASASAAVTVQHHPGKQAEVLGPAAPPAQPPHNRRSLLLGGEPLGQNGAHLQQ